MKYESQLTSELFRIPIEIRRAIYADLINTAGIHITLSAQGGCQLTRCLDPDLAAENVGDERRPLGEWEPNRLTWARRVDSSWGPHWECEEIAVAKFEKGHQESEATSGCSFLTVCQRLYFEIQSWMSEQMCYHITDLATASKVLDPSIVSSETLESPHMSFIHSLLPYITKLDITLSLPLTFFQYFQSPSSIQGGDEEEVQHLKGLAETWASLPRGFAIRCPALRRLRIWLDHTDGSYWSDVNERAVLRHFEQLARSPHLDLSCDLPKLLPLRKDPTRHFLDDEGASESGASSLPSPIQIRRRLRQRWRVNKTDAGYDRPRWVRDFPFTFGIHQFTSVSLEELEQMETTMELHGQSVDHLIQMTQHLLIPDPEIT